VEAFSLQLSSSTPSTSRLLQGLENVKSPYSSEKLFHSSFPLFWCVWKGFSLTQHAKGVCFIVGINFGKNDPFLV